MERFYAMVIGTNNVTFCDFDLNSFKGPTATEHIANITFLFVTVPVSEIQGRVVFFESADAASTF